MNAIKSDFCGGLGRYISKFRKNAHFFEVFEIHLPTPPSEKYIYKERQRKKACQCKDYRVVYMRTTMLYDAKKCLGNVTEDFLLLLSPFLLQV